MNHTIQINNNFIEIIRRRRKKSGLYNKKNTVFTVSNKTTLLDTTLEYFL